MSMRSRAQAPAPALTAEQFPSILAGLILAQPSDRTVLTILGLATVHRPPAVCGMRYGATSRGPAAIKRCWPASRPGA